MSAELTTPVWERFLRVLRRWQDGAPRRARALRGCMRQVVRMGYGGAADLEMAALLVARALGRFPVLRL